MSTMKRAIRGVWRNAGRSVPAALVLAAVIAVSAAALLIIKAARGAVDGYREQYGAVVTIAPDIGRLTAGATGAPGGKGIVVSASAFPGISPGLYASFAQSDCLKGSALSATVPAAGAGIRAVGMDDTDGTGLPAPDSGKAAPPVPVMKIIGNSDTANLPGFVSGQRKLISGRMYQSAGECVVSREFAGLNGLSAGGEFTVRNAVTQARYRLTVTGVYSDSAPEYDIPALRAAYLNRRNEILTGFETAAAGDSGDTGAIIEASYILKSPDMMAAFESELRAKGLPDAYAPAVDTAGFNRAAGPAEGLERGAAIALAAAVALGAAALTLMSSAAAGKRRREIAALRIMGMKQRAVFRGFLSETLIIAFVSLAAGLPAGAALAKPAAAGLASIQAVRSAVTVKTFRIDSGPGAMLTTETRREGVIFAKGQEPDSAAAVDIRVGPDMGVGIAAALIALALAAAVFAAAVRAAGRCTPVQALSQNSNQRK